MAGDDGFVTVERPQRPPKEQRAKNAPKGNPNNRNNQNRNRNPNAPSNKNNNAGGNKNKGQTPAVTAQVNSAPKSTPKTSGIQKGTDLPPNPVAKMFANMMQNRDNNNPNGPKMSGKITEVAISDAFIHRNMTRSYELTRPPPEGYQAVLKKMFPSMDVCMVNTVEIKGKLLPSLFIHFSETHDQGHSDYDKSEFLNFSVQGIALRLQAVGSDRTDAEGTYIPKINKNIYATGVPFSLTRNAEFLKETFGQWVDLDHSDSIKMIYEDGMYKGSIVVPVLEYNKLPPRIINFPFFTLNAYGSYEKVPNATCKVNLFCTGLDPSMKPNSAAAMR